MFTKLVLAFVMVIPSIYQELEAYITILFSKKKTNSNMYCNHSNKIFYCYFYCNCLILCIS